jgi:hypothetical protein
MITTIRTASTPAVPRYGRASAPGRAVAVASSVASAARRSRSSWRGAGRRGAHRRSIRRWRAPTPRAPARAPRRRACRCTPPCDRPRARTRCTRWRHRSGPRRTSGTARRQAPPALPGPPGPPGPRARSGRAPPGPPPHPSLRTPSRAGTPGTSRARVRPRSRSSPRPARDMTHIRRAPAEGVTTRPGTAPASRSGGRSRASRARIPVGAGRAACR